MLRESDFLGTPIPLKSVLNAREYGGYRTSLGVIKPRLILRGGELSKLSPEDKAKLLHDYNLKLVIDLRSIREINNLPDQEIEGVRHIHLDIIGDTFDFNGDPQDMVKKMNEHTSDELMEELYSAFTTKPAPTDALKRFFKEAIELEEGSMYVHCTAGKDRTGIASALLLYILGASNELIAYDYVLSNHYRKDSVEQEIREINENLKTRMSEKDEMSFRILNSVHEKFLLLSFMEAEKIYGTLDNYLLYALELTEEKKELLRNKFLIRS
ncbi:MAG: tyrosine-protein phosphatase [Clostridiaceae bacterium]